MWTIFCVIKLICIFLGRFSISGFMFDDPCEVSPPYSDGIPNNNDFTATAEVPANCKNGTFRWDNPRGHTMLEFQNVHKAEKTICIKDSLGGTVFNITDKVTNQRLGNFDRKHWACFKSTTAQDIVLQVDAPLFFRYMGAFEYKITN